jgi:hypothetical protein
MMRTTQQIKKKLKKKKNLSIFPLGREEMGLDITRKFLSSKGDMLN